MAAVNIAQLPSVELFQGTAQLFPEPSAITSWRRWKVLVVVRLLGVRAAPGTDVIIHEVPRTRIRYGGPLEADQDLMRIESGPTVEVHRFSP